MIDDSFLFVVGGARSGKSDFAVEAARRRARPTTFLATAQAGDDDMADRIRHHQQDRPQAWALIEEPVALADAIALVDPEHTLVLDCLTLWTANVVFAEWTAAAVVAEAARVAELLAARTALSIVVSNEVGLGVHPATDLGRDYRDLLGRINTTVAAEADRRLFFSSGRAIELQEPFALLGRAADPSPAGPPAAP